MVHYTTEDLDRDWEFKIVRANTQAFRKPHNLQSLLAREAQAGWIMVEKFDDMRVRFKRPRQARLNDPSLPPGVDPYCTTYGMAQGAYALLVVGLALGLAGGLIALVAFLAR